MKILAALKPILPWLGVIVPGGAFVAAILRVWKVRVGGQRVRDAWPIGNGPLVGAWSRELSPEEVALLKGLSAKKASDLPVELQKGLIGLVPF